jgi:hypothetical protein
VIGRIGAVCLKFPVTLLTTKDSLLEAIIVSAIGVLSEITASSIQKCCEVSVLFFGVHKDPRAWRGPSFEDPPVHQSWE